jgi:hypothetical protein
LQLLTKTFMATLSLRLEVGILPTHETYRIVTTNEGMLFGFAVIHDEKIATRGC